GGVVAAAAQVGGKRQRPRGGQLGHKRVGDAAAELGLRRGGRDREVRGGRLAGHVGVAGAVDRDGGGAVVRRAAQVGRVGQRAVGPDLADEDVVVAGVLRLLAGDGRKVRRLRDAGDVDVTGGVHGDAVAAVYAAAAHVRRVIQDRVDY